MINPIWIRGIIDGLSPHLITLHSCLALSISPGVVWYRRQIRNVSLEMILCRGSVWELLLLLQNKGQWEMLLLARMGWHLFKKIVHTEGAKDWILCSEDAALKRKKQQRKGKRREMWTLRKALWVMLSKVTFRNCWVDVLKLWSQTCTQLWTAPSLESWPI